MIDPSMKRELVDIDNAWAKEEINMAYESKMVNVPPNGQFLPDDTVTKADVATALTQAFSIANNDASLLDKFKSDAESPFYDVPKSHPAYNAIRYATSEGFVGPAEKSFEPSGSMSGADLFWMIYHVKKKF